LSCLSKVELNEDLYGRLEDDEGKKVQKLVANSSYVVDWDNMDFFPLLLFNDGIVAIR
jgi:hypothetical protein